MTSHLGHKTMPFDEQQEQLDNLRSRVQELSSEGYEIMQIDESVFSPKHVRNTGYAPANDPLTVPFKWVWKQYVACVGAISVEAGVVHYHTKKGAYTTEEIL